MTPTKILEVKTNDWMKGLSIQSGLALGGLFQSANNFDPFDTMGYFIPSFAPVQIDATINTQIDNLFSLVNGTDAYVYALGAGSAAKTKTLFRIKLSDQTVTDYSDQIDQNGASQFTHNGMTYYKSRIIYTQSGSLRSNTPVPVTTNDTNILTSANCGSTLFPTMFATGPDQALYYTATAGPAIGKIASVVDTSGNTASAFSFTDTSLIPKDITCDGTYLVFIADNNDYKSTLGTSKCKVFFWDTISSKATYIYDVPDSYLISCRFVDGKILIIGASGLWACNQVTAPKLILPITSSKLPTGANKVTTNNNILTWISGRQVYSYGSKIGSPILYNPYYTNDSDNLGTAICSCGTQFMSAVDAGTNTPKVYLQNSGTTRGNANISTATIPLVQPYKLSHIKITLKEKLTAGQSLIVNLYNGEDLVIMNSTTLSTVGKKTFICNPNPVAGSVNQFEDLYVTVSSVNGAIVQRVTGYGIAEDDFNQNI